MQEDNTKLYEKEFESFKTKEYTEEEVKTVLENEDKLIKKSQSGALSVYLDQIKLLYSMLQDYFSGNYKEIPKTAIGPVLWTLFYLINPIDIMPDFIPIFGHLDDVALLVMCSRFVAVELEKYKQWKANADALDHIFEEDSNGTD